jgi:hypothetical protein
MRFFNFDPFQHHSRQDLTVGGLRAAAKAKGVDTTAKSQGGESPLAAGDKRIVTSGDIVGMFTRHAEAA